MLQEKPLYPSGALDTPLRWGMALSSAADFRHIDKLIG